MRPVMVGLVSAGRVSVFGGVMPFFRTDCLVAVMRFVMVGLVSWSDCLLFDGA